MTDPRFPHGPDLPDFDPCADERPDRLSFVAGFITGVLATGFVWAVVEGVRLAAR